MGKEIPAKTPQYFGREVPTSDEQIEEAVKRRREGKSAPNIVVGTKTYEQAQTLVEGFKNIRIDSGITEGGVMLHMNNKWELKRARKYLNQIGLRMNLGITQKEDGRKIIEGMHEIIRRIDNSLDN